MDLETLNPDAVEDIFARHGACSITLTDAGDSPVLEPSPGETRLWPELRITGLFSPDADLDALKNDLRQSLAIDELPPNDIAELENRDWEREWLKHFAAMQFGKRLWICPTGSRVTAGDAVVLHLDPGLAFGTGTHATTALCLEWLDGLQLAGARVLDYGCGSGVLAIASVLLGAEHAVAMDIDPQAVVASTDNAARNAVGDRITVVGGAGDIKGQFDVVVANILAGPLIALAESIASRVRAGCKLALSGILSGQVDEVRAAYHPWIRFDEPALRDQGGQTWARLTGRRIED